VRFAVEAWAPEYGGSIEESALVESDEPTDLTVEVPAADWGPRSVTAPRATTVLFVDGVQRIDARVWVEAEDGRAHQGICASYGAGVVHADGHAAVVAARVERGLFCAAAGAETIETRAGRYRHVAVASDDAMRLWRCVGQSMGDLEVAVARTATADDPEALIVVDGPLRQHRALPGAVGYIKTFHRSYGGAVVDETLRRLAPGERTPLMVIGAGFTRYSWYVRLPEAGPPAHSLAGLVRCEVSADTVRAEVLRIADRVTATLPRFASRPHKDTRAPQNLYPIAGLERELRRRLGDPALLYRALRAAAA
jgi:hypothetical protein